jgi:hypothetical protein
MQNLGGPGPWSKGRADPRPRNAEALGFPAMSGRAMPFRERSRRQRASLDEHSFLTKSRAERALVYSVSRETTRERSTYRWRTVSAPPEKGEWPIACPCWTVRTPVTEGLGLGRSTKRRLRPMSGVNPKWVPDTGSMETRELTFEERVEGHRTRGGVRVMLRLPATSSCSAEGRVGESETRGTAGRVEKTSS